MYKALTIAGSDPSGGAGIQADLKTMTMHSVYGMSVITALTSQNTTGVKEIMEVEADFLSSQLDAVFEDIFPDAVKCGMMPNSTSIEVVAQRLAFYKADNIVVDPVMISTSGQPLMDEEAIKTLKEKLLPLASLVTPNIPEAQFLSGLSIKCKEDMEKSALLLSHEFHAGVLIKGGHSDSDADDCLCLNEKIQWFPGKRINNPNTHGTGCTLSSAIASNLAKGICLSDSIKNAKEYLYGAIEYGLDLGKGPGPLNHMYQL